MDRKQVKIIKNDHTAEAKVTIKFEDGPFDAKRQIDVLKTLFESPTLTRCYGRLFERLTISYDGERFVVEARADVPLTDEIPPA